MNRLLRITAPLAVLGLTVAAVVIMVTFRPEPEQAQPEERPVSVFVERAERTTIVPLVTTQGEVRARIEIDLVPQVAGRIVEVSPAFVDGGIFEAGEVLIRIEDADYELALTRAQAQVAEARQALIQEDAQADMARRDWEELGDGDASPLTLREPQLARAQASLAAAQANLAEARLNLDRTRITVPFDGRIRSRSADLGQFVSPGNRLGRVFSTDVVEIRLPLSDSELGILDLPIGYRAAPGEGHPIDLSAVVGGRERHWAARIVRTESALDPTTRQLFAVAELLDPYGAGADKDGVPLAVGLFVTADIPGRPVDDTLVIPRAALRASDRVYVVTEENRLSIRRVDVAFTEEERIILNSGVEDGDMVIVSPIQGAIEGLKLTPIERSVSETAAPGDGA